MPDPAVDEEALPGWDLHAPLGAGLSAAPFFSPLPDFPTPDRHLWHQLLHLSPERVLPADEEHHQVRSGGITPKLLPHVPWLLLSEFGVGSRCRGSSLSYLQGGCVR